MELNINKMPKLLTVDVKLTGIKQFEFRVLVGVLLMRLAFWFMNIEPKFSFKAAK